jgi:AcrR family transcriptional regulator
VVARTPDLALKQKLLDSVVGYFAKHGLADASLRPIAAELGVSVNALVHHFGSKDELVVAALRRAIDMQVEVQDKWLKREPYLSEAERLRKWWKWLVASDENLALVRLGIEAAALDATAVGIPGPVRAEQISVWRLTIKQNLVAEGLAPDTAEVEASLAKAMFTGLVIDLLATGDKRRLTASLDLGLERLEKLLAG